MQSIPVPNSDCDYLTKIMQFMGNSMKQDYATVTNCCQFRGIVCDNQQHITEIQFKNYKDYSADINSAIGEMENLHYLTSLDLTNFITATDDSLTNKIGNLKSLKTLIIKDNYIDFLGSKIPEEIGNLTNLEKLDLSNNSFGGPLPKSLGKLENLKILNLKDNSFEGTIPYEFKSLNNLEEFDINGSTKLYGYVPLLPKVTHCDYGVTELCSLKSSKCKSSLDDCTKEEIKKTNKENGNPNSSDESQYEENEKDFSSNNMNFIAFIVLAVIICIIMCLLLCKCRKRRHKKFDYEENQNNNAGSADAAAATTTPNTNINVNINANLSPYSGPVQTVDITDTNLPASGFVDITTPYDNALTPYTSSAASPTPVSPSNDYNEPQNKPQEQVTTYDHNYISPPNPSTYNNNSMFAGPANGFVDITTPYDNALTPYTSNANSPTPSSPNNNYYGAPNSPQNPYNQNPVPPIGFVPPPNIAYPPNNYNN